MKLSITFFSSRKSAGIGVLLPGWDSVYTGRNHFSVRNAFFPGQPAEGITRLETSSSSCSILPLLSACDRQSNMHRSTESSEREQRSAVEGNSINPPIRKNARHSVVGQFGFCEMAVPAP